MIAVGRTGIALIPIGYGLSTKLWHMVLSECIGYGLLGAGNLATQNAAMDDIFSSNPIVVSVVLVFVVTVARGKSINFPRVEKLYKLTVITAFPRRMVSEPRWDWHGDGIRSPRGPDRRSRGRGPRRRRNVPRKLRERFPLPAP